MHLTNSRAQEWPSQPTTSLPRANLSRSRPDGVVHARAEQTNALSANYWAATRGLDKTTPRTGARLGNQLQRRAVDVGAMGDRLITAETTCRAAPDQGLRERAAGAYVQPARFANILPQVYDAEYTTSSETTFEPGEYSTRASSSPEGMPTDGIDTVFAETLGSTQTFLRRGKHELPRQLLRTAPARVPTNLTGWTQQVRSG